MVGSKKVKQQIQGIQEANKSCITFLEYLTNKYKFNGEELEDIEKLQYHLSDLNKNLGNVVNVIPGMMK
ncbi:hypothetical protein P9027_31415 [Bacillus thuringiensis]|uniref:hypothetical protein n=1 Tax=Bacillus cereus group TaxID=86661 RepID=UPI000BFDE3B0|nr:MULTISPECIES: hypothetical protein [Bacillus cereus group]MEC3226414.1 hypothetical protein [Bacillus thuringiensis]MEC3463151.1 hypothetical protein [Bacillus thuringiensis]MEC3553556.1 hypothetical protein [Bacillus thuringiensis]MED2059979.1 hypothetical protein [Bacillus thuringiensis]PHB32869.1 hypothetical protein COE86_23700 [Bacillus toyonensis]